MKFFKRIFRYFFSLRLLGKILFVCAFLATLAALLVVEENWRAKRAWESYRAEKEAHGERLDMQPLIPPAVPDDQNFAMTPLLKPMFPATPSTYASDLGKKLDYPHPKDQKAASLGNRLTGQRFDPVAWKAYFGGEDVLPWIEKLDPELHEISEALRRPYSRFPIAYEKGFSASLPHMGVLMKLSKLYALRARAELHDGRPDAAMADVQSVFRLSQSVKDEPLLISMLVRIAICQVGLQAVWEGLEERKWTDAQLSELQTSLEKEDFPKGLALAFRGERASANDFLSSALKKPEIIPVMISMSEARENSQWRFMPGALIYRNMLAVNQYHDRFRFASDSAAHRISPDVFKDAESSLLDVTVSVLGLHPPNLYKALARLLLPALNSVGSKAAYTQVSIDEAVIACALERHRLANGQYPDALEKLMPAYLKTLPPDVTTGEKLHYRLNDDGTFLLYSTGWDGKDEGGKAVLRKNGGIDEKRGNWPWALKAGQAPAPKPAG